MKNVLKRKDLKEFNEEIGEVLTNDLAKRIKGGGVYLQNIYDKYITYTQTTYVNQPLPDPILFP